MRTLAEKKRVAVREPAASVISQPPSAQPSRPPRTVVAALVEALAELGFEEAFGVCGGAIAPLFDALEESPIALRHFRHEAGAAFAAAEAHFASRKPVAVFATT